MIAGRALDATGVLALDEVSVIVEVVIAAAIVVVAATVAPIVLVIEEPIVEAAGPIVEAAEPIVEVAEPIVVMSPQKQQPLACRWRASQGRIAITGLRG